MTGLVTQTEYLRFEIDPQLKERLNAVFERQGTIQKTGMNRLIEFFVDQPEEIQAMILGQLRGQAVTDLSVKLLERFVDTNVRSGTSTARKPPKVEDVTG